VQLTALRISLALALAFLAALTDLIPSIGATLGVVLLAVFFVVYQMLENYLIAPRVMHGSVQLRAGAVLLATLIGGTALGLVGALTGEAGPAGPSTRKTAEMHSVGAQPA
jgi:predicted PurR-regulated permease PerM